MTCKLALNSSCVYRMKWWKGIVQQEQNGRIIFERMSVEGTIFVCIYKQLKWKCSMGSQFITDQTVPLVTDQTVSLVTDQTVPLVTDQTVPLVTDQTVPLVTDQTVPLVTDRTVSLNFMSYSSRIQIHCIDRSNVKWYCPLKIVLSLFVCS